VYVVGDAQRVLRADQRASVCIISAKNSHKLFSLITKVFFVVGGKREGTKNKSSNCFANTIESGLVDVSRRKR
jgi:hypothetical protein